MLGPEQELEIYDIQVGHVDCYPIAERQGITFSVNNENINKIINQIGLGNILDTIPETSQILDLIHPSNITDYLVCTYKKDEVISDLIKGYEQVGDEHTFSFKDYDEHWNKIREIEHQQVINQLRNKEYKTILISLKDKNKYSETFSKMNEDGFVLVREDKNYEKQEVIAYFVKYLN